MKTLANFTTFATQKSFPSKLWRFFLVMVVFFVQSLISALISANFSGGTLISMATESNMTPKYTIWWVGSSAFLRDSSRPKSANKVARREYDS